jgi:hypothetical protein
LIDFCIGVIGWLNVTVYFGSNYVGLNDNIKGLITVTTAVLVVTDIWCPILFIGLFYLIYTYNEFDLAGDISGSDDSELDELGLRGPGLSRVEVYIPFDLFLSSFTGHNYY